MLLENHCIKLIQSNNIANNTITIYVMRVWSSFFGNIFIHGIRLWFLQEKIYSIMNIADTIIKRPTEVSLFWKTDANKEQEEEMTSIMIQLCRFVMTACAENNSFTQKTLVAEHLQRKQCLLKLHQIMINRRDAAARGQLITRCPTFCPKTML